MTQGYPPYQPHIIVQQPRHRRGVSSLGLASVVIGIIALIGSIVPFCYVISYPLAILGVILAAVGFVAALASGEKGFGAPIMGVIFNVAAMILPFVLIGGLLGTLDKMREEANRQRNATTQPTSQPTTRNSR